MLIIREKATSNAGGIGPAQPARSTHVTDPSKPEPTPPPPRKPPPDTPPTAESRTLFGGSRLVLIVHEGTTYTLRQTRQGKLILTK
jgi:hemin uptake protein HemP